MENEGKKKKPPMISIAVRVDEALHSRIKILAEKDGREVSSYARRVLQLHVQAAFKSAAKAIERERRLSR